MYTLLNFYRSKQWEKLIRVIKQEWINEQGYIFCKHCGKPIIRSYDCIAHHITELTEENVNDVSVSLNPDNIALVHHGCHNRMHNKLGNAERRVYLVWGSPLSGKSSWVRENMNVGDLVVDIDSVWQCVSGLDRYVKPGRLNAVVFGIKNELLDMVRMRRGKWINAYVIGGYPLTAERERITGMLDAYEIFIDTEKKECLKRLQESDDRDKGQWEQYISDWWEKFSPAVPPGC